MDVVGHDDEFIVEQFNIRAQLGGAEPFVAGYLAQGVEVHFVVIISPEEVLAFVGDEGDEITALGGVVVSFEADGAAVMRWRGIDHVEILKSVGENVNRSMCISPVGA